MTIELEQEPMTQISNEQGPWPVTYDNGRPIGWPENFSLQNIIIFNNGDGIVALPRTPQLEQFEELWGPLNSADVEEEM